MCFAQDAAVRSQVEAALQNLQLERAAQFSQHLPPQKEGPYYRARIRFLHYLCHEDADLLPQFYAVTQSSLQSLAQLPGDDPEKGAMMAELHFLRGAAKLLDDKLLGAALDIRNACRLLDRQARRFPEQVAQRKLLGVFHVGISALPNKLRWLGNALCLPGDLATGLRYLEEAAALSPWMASEAEIILFYYEKNLLGDPVKALNRVDRLLAKHPESKVYSYLRLSALLDSRRGDDALRFAEEQEALFEQQPGTEALPIWDYSRAKAHYFKLEFAQAIRYFDRFLAQYKGATLGKDAMFRKGMSLVLLDRYPEARRIFHEMGSVKGSNFDEDAYASRMATIFRFKAPNPTEQNLFRARNLFDGGYYHRALQVLETLELSPELELNPNQKTELHYRKGRIYQAMGDLYTAREHYLACTRSDPALSLWMKVYAHYYLGQVAEKQGKPAKARSWYAKSLEFDGYDYQSGLEQRSKTALENLKGINY